MAYILSGQVVVPTAGTAVQLPSIITTEDGSNWFIRANSSNTGHIWIGNDGANDVSPTTGFCMAAGDAMQLNVPDMSYYWIDADVDGEGITWLKPGGFH